MNPFVEELSLDNINKGELALFCGAGISRNSGIPIVEFFLEYVFTQFGLSSTEIKILLQNEQPFEKVMETFLRINEVNLKKHLLNAFDDTEMGLSPNEIHNWVAKLADEKKVSLICTTNFDTLIEKSLQELKVPYKLYCFENGEIQNTIKGSCKCLGRECESFQSIDWKSDVLKVIKIHGCIKSRDKMVVTIKSIAASKRLELRTQCIKDIFSSLGIHNKILILGYSSSDIFDIVPVFKKIRTSNKNIFYLNHGNVEIYRKLQSVYNIRNSKEKFNPFRQWRGNHYWLNYDTDLFINTPRQKNIKNEKWKESVNEYVESFKNGELAFLKALLFKRSNIYENNSDKNSLALSLHYYKLARIGFRESKNILGIGSSYNNEAMIYKNMGKLKKALLIYERASRLFKKKKDLLRLAKSYGNRANILRHLGDLEEAFELTKEALEIFKQIASIEDVSISYGNLALISTELNNTRDSRRYHKIEMRICEELGDPEGLAQCFINKSILMRNLGKFKTALSFCNKAKKTFEDTNNFQELSFCYINKAIVLNKLGKNEKALKLHKKGEKISEEYNHIYNLIITYSNQSKILEEIGNTKESILLFKKSLKLAKKHGYKFLEKQLSELCPSNKMDLK